MNSSWITEVRYSFRTRQLTVQMHGKDYTFDGVPLWVVGVLHRSRSAGKAYHKHVAGRYQQTGG